MKSETAIDGKSTYMLKSLRDHWPNYLIEAWGLGTFMVSAGGWPPFSTPQIHP